MDSIFEIHKATARLIFDPSTNHFPMFHPPQCDQRCFEFVDNVDVLRVHVMHQRFESSVPTGWQPVVVLL